MRFFSKAAAATAAAGIAVIGTIAAGGGVANAATSQSVTGCTGNSGLLGLGVFPTCSANDSTVINPTSLTVNITGNLLSVLGTVLPGLGQTVSFTLTCSVNGNPVSVPESFTSTDPADTSETIDLQSAVGSPVPNFCTVQDMTATSTLALNLASLLKKFSFGGNVTANTAVSGAVYSSAGKAGSLTANICADDEGNGNAGAQIQVYQCNSDLAQYWVQSSTGQLVRNGDCMTQSGSKVVLARCSPTNKAQVWDVKGTGGSVNTIVNSSSGQCLTWPKAVSFTQLTGSACKAKTAGQLWTGPAKSAA